MYYIPYWQQTVGKYRRISNIDMCQSQDILSKSKKAGCAMRHAYVMCVQMRFTFTSIDTEWFRYLPFIFRIPQRCFRNAAIVSGNWYIQNNNNNNCILCMGMITFTSNRCIGYFGLFQFQPSSMWIVNAERSKTNWWKAMAKSNRI